MKLEFTAPIEDLTIANPVINSTDRVATSVVTDKEGSPFVIKIHTTATEEIHDAKNRAWVDIALTDEECISVFDQLDAHLLDSVYEKHHTPEWFDKKAPRSIIEEYCKSFIESQKSKPEPFLRLKTEYKGGNPRVELHTSTVNKPESATVTELQSLESLAGREVVYEVHVGGIRFCPTTFNPELKLVAIHSYVNKGDYDMFEMVLGNATHREQKNRILEQQQKMEEYSEEKRQLEGLKAEVEIEVANILAKRDDIEQRYSDVVNRIEQMQTDVAFEDYDEIDTDGAAAEAVDSEEASPVEDDGLVQESEGCADGVACAKSVEEEAAAAIQEHLDSNSEHQVLTSENESSGSTGGKVVEEESTDNASA